MQNLPLNENYYFVVFIDDFSRIIWVYFTKNTYEVFYFKKNLRQKLVTKLNFCLHIEGENFFQKFLNIFQQNNIAEGKNMSLLDMTKTMIKAKNLPNKFWSEVIFTITYILNGVLHKH